MLTGEPVAVRIATCLTEILIEKNLRWTDLNGPGLSGTSIDRIRRGENYRMSTLIAAVDALGYEMVVNFREKT